MDTIYITGHRNPDTDSIVSAMAYAALKNALGQRQYEAARLGQISDETQTVLDRFGFQPPKLLNNVRTQVRDLDYDTPATLSAAATISRAWRTMQKDKISAIPVANEDGTLFGMLSAGDVANYDMSSVRNPKVGEIPVYNLLSVLEGKILNQGGEMRDVISGEVTIALPASRENLVFSDPGSIVVCGDQPDMIRRALEIGVSCIIVCQAEVDPELLAMQTDTCIISTAYDAYRAVRLIYHAMPISSICKNKDLVCFHLDDYIDDVQNTVLESRFRAYPILDEEERVVGTLSRYHLLRPRRKQVILMDHNEKAQSVPGLDQAEILEIIDHHRLADIQTKNPITVRNEPVGSTTTIVAGMYQDKGRQDGGIDGRGHRLRYGHVQVSHLHPAGHRRGQPHGPDRQHLPPGAGTGDLLRLRRRCEVCRGDLPHRLQGVPHRRPQPGGEPGHLHGLRPAAPAQGRVFAAHELPAEEAGLRHGNPDDYRCTAGGHPAAVRGRQGQHPPGLQCGGCGGRGVPAQGHVPEKAGHSHALRPVGLRSAWPRRPALSAEEAAGRLRFLGNLLPLKHFPEILYKFTIDFACLKQYGVKVQRPVGRRELFHGFVCSSVPHCGGVLSILWLPGPLCGPILS